MTTKENKKFKNTVFVDLFYEDESANENDIALYNALHDEQLPLLDKCSILKEYSQFVETVTKYSSDGKEDPYKRAIEECIQKGILADYLKRKGSEVMNMLIAEYDYDMDIEVQREEAYNAGIRRVNQLHSCLLKDNRFEDLKKSTEDPDYQKQLLKEYDL